MGNHTKWQNANDGAYHEAARVVSQLPSSRILTWLTSCVGGGSASHLSSGRWSKWDLVGMTFSSAVCLDCVKNDLV